MHKYIITTLLATVLLASSIFISCGPAKGTAEWYFEQGNNLTEEGRYAEAIEDYDEAIRLNPRYADAYCCRGVAYCELGQYERGIDD